MPNNTSIPQQPEWDRDIPVLLIVFSRLDTTQKVFERIRLAQPKRLYIAADGARAHKQGETEKVEAVRHFLINAVDWDCEVKTKFEAHNLGCKYNPQSAISWFFGQEEMGIILEDDCVPSTTFFPYCSELLHRYKEDLRIWGISGSNLVEDFHEGPKDTYFFSEFFMTWGWASWRNRWKKHEENLENFDFYLSTPLFKEKFKNATAAQQMVNRARISYKDKLDAWDYQWLYTCMINHGLLATPYRNQIYNIGFGEEATHTTNKSGMSIQEKNIELPIQHPQILLPDRARDNAFFKRIFGWMSKREKLTNLYFLKAYIRSKF